MLRKATLYRILSTVKPEDLTNWYRTGTKEEFCNRKKEKNRWRIVVACRTVDAEQHSMGSEAGYSLKAADAPRAVVGRGSMHMEVNYGDVFPTGWIWAQVRRATRNKYPWRENAGMLLAFAYCSVRCVPGFVFRGTARRRPLVFVYLCTSDVKRRVFSAW